VVLLAHQCTTRALEAIGLAQKISVEKHAARRYLPAPSASMSANGGWFSLLLRPSAPAAHLVGHGRHAPSSRKIACYEGPATCRKCKSVGRGRRREACLSRKKVCATKERSHSLAGGVSVRTPGSVPPQRRNGPSLRVTFEIFRLISAGLAFIKIPSPFFFSE